jgi:hypothetical protein
MHQKKLAEAITAKAYEPPVYETTEQSLRRLTNDNMFRPAIEKLGRDKHGNVERNPFESEPGAPPEPQKTASTLEPKRGRWWVRQAKKWAEAAGERMTVEDFDALADPSGPDSGIRLHTE